MSDPQETPEEVKPKVTVQIGKPKLKPTLKMPPEPEGGWPVLKHLPPKKVGKGKY